MKRILAMILAMAPLFCCACSATPGGVASSTPAEATTAGTTAPPAPPPPDTPALTFAAPLTGDGRIKKVASLTASPAAYEMVELELQIDGVTGNVYDPEQVSLDMELISSDGQTMQIIGFYYVPYTADANGYASNAPTGQPSWRFRFTPPTEGYWSFSITLTEQGSAVDSISGHIAVAGATDTRGFLGVEPKNRQVFAFDDGTVFVPIGLNVCWSSGVPGNAVYAYYDDINKKLHASGANHTRTWLASWCLSIITGGRAPSDLSGGMQRAAMLDWIMESYAENEIYVTIAIFHHGMFSIEANPDWNSSPFNKNNNPNGYLDHPAKFFTDERAKKDAKLYIRYLIARYGYSRNILTWELFNEIDQTASPTAPALEWHREMAEYIKSIDPYGHLLSTSAARNQNTIPFDSVFDFVQLHWYNYGDLQKLTNLQRTAFLRVRSPILFAEAGAFEGNNQIAMTSANPVMVHQQHWMGVMGGGAGTGMTWYWEEFDRYNCYYLFRPISDFAARIPWNDRTMAGYSASTGDIRAIGYTGRGFAYVWMYDSAYKHERQGSGILRSGYTFSVNLLKAGTYNVEWIDTKTGEIVKAEEVTITAGMMELTAPDWRGDLAVAVELQ